MMNENDKTEILEPVETPAENITEPGKDGRKCPKWLPPLIAAICAVILVAAGIVGWNMYRGAKLAEAKEACAAADTVRSNANEYNALLNGDAADASAVKAEQVKDSKTVEALGKELKAMAPEYEGCVAEDAQGLDAATVKLNEQADWYETHEKSLSKAVRAVTESKAAKTLETAKTNLTAKLGEASKLLADSDGKVADNATRDALSNAIDAANGLKDGNDPAKIDGARKTVEDAINGVNASVQAKTDADAQAAAAAAQARAQAQSAYNGGSSYSGGAYRRTGGPASGSNTYRGTTGGTGSGSTSGSGPAGGSAPKPNLNGAYGCGNSCTGKDDGYYHH
ncbi:colicin transporter [Bifidobacterium breve]|uniref:colicin transporter n=1 Tax=Bifidobacterium breve TaxID=1685 RepID=UPI0022B01945|nr:colicin transporter [Bifidobacterium breve]MCZ4466896.1 colicin transporter [Bifidobacterium breve]MCZ4468786.1 colicin transporter [Bifidobacterium breve]MCZ4472542.1 colicin transporter [Bifidobacterium breve]